MSKSKTSLHFMINSIEEFLKFPPKGTLQMQIDGGRLCLIEWKKQLAAN